MLEESSIEAIESLNATVEAKDPYTAGHSVRVQRIAVAIAQELGVPPKDLDAVRFGGLFHDIGKIAIPDALLTKPSPLTAGEIAIVQMHVEVGADILEATRTLADAAPGVRASHEWFGGTGYPRKASGNAIPFASRVIAVADAYDAMTQDRAYRRRLDSADAVTELLRGCPAQFDPRVVAAFLAVLSTH